MDTNVCVRPELLYGLIYRPPLCNFPESRKKNLNFFLFCPPTLNIICFIVKIFLRFCLFIFESATVKSDCPVQENYEIFKDFKQTVGLLY